ncbi:2TM domain-containing protein [Hymenobacter busanensis]|uniref:2TM domain-containing protein n=1 Tax=Hymenobacter busanensis TaxID=2607656 RepID=A0A7L5A1E0_9BACT|nr:2TM domain-containing protein [Hymenobacter busanensis]KAA9332131.1 2TM domain-containing protein [Hymenobacter busanensis]QHJ07530.1 hypothetical protein GUY19_09645 [Hymenobacter busanensis]
METPARDPHLWRLAKARAKFKAHLLTYASVNALLWLIWLLTHNTHHVRLHHRGPFDWNLPWPVWPMLFWGLVLVWQGLCAYGFANTLHSPEREYDRLLRNRQDLQR